MRKILMLLSMFLFLGTIAFGQTRDVTGQVIGDDNAPIPFASVKIKNTNTGVTADENGKFTIRAKAGDVLVITSTNTKTKEFQVGTTNNFVIKTEKNTRQEEIVVVTGAMNVKKSQRNQTSSVQVLTAEQINTTRQPNLGNALAGKVVGTQTRSQSTAKLNDQPFIRIRGVSGVNGERGAIFVVDGTIVNAFDINPDDVESMTVLKGANATVLFGDRAANGAIVITTRKKTKSKLQVEYNQSVVFENANILMRYQNKYAGGSGGWQTFRYRAGMPTEWAALDGKRYHDQTDDASWGPLIDGGQHIPWYAWVPGTKYTGKTVALTAQPSNINQFWETGITTNSNVSLFKTIKNGGIRLTYNNTQIKGLLPNSSSGRNTVTFSGNYDITPKIAVSANVNYSLNKIKGEFNDDYGNNSTGSFSSWFHRDLDFRVMKELRGLRTPIGTLATWNTYTNPNNFNTANPQDFWRANYWYNPYAFFDNISNTSDRNRIFGDVRLTFKPIKDLTINATVRNNTLNTNITNITRSIVESSAAQSGILAGYAVDDQVYQENNYELLANYRKSVKKFDFDYLLGANVLNIKQYRDFATTNGGLNVPDVYSLDNSVNPITRNLKGPDNIVSHLQNRAWFSSLDVNYNKFLNFNGAIRQDWYSVLPVNDNQLTSYSYGAGIIFSDLLKEKASWLSYGKIYGSIGQKPLASVGFAATDSRFLSGGNYVIYSPTANLYGTDTLMGTPNNATDGGISGTIIKTNEIGLDLKFLKNRFGINVVYYDEIIDNEPASITVSGISGYTSILSNAASIKRRGLEFELFVHAVKKTNFDWKINFNLAKILNNDVLDLDGNLDTKNERRLFQGGAFGTRFARAFQVENQLPYQMIGKGILRNADGQPVVLPSGLYAQDIDRNFGSAIPTVTGGFFNNFTFGRFNAAVNIDYQFGGKFFSLSEAFASYSGLAEWTAGTNDRGVPVRESLANGGGVRVRGVSSVDQKTPVDMYVTAFDYFRQYFDNQIADPFIHSLSFIKLREVSVGYNFPTNKWKVGKWIKGANFSVISRNPLLIYRESQNFDPSEISGIYGENANMPASRSMGVNFRLTF